MRDLTHKEQARAVCRIRLSNREPLVLFYLAGNGFEDLQWKSYGPIHGSTSSHCSVKSIIFQLIWIIQEQDSQDLFIYLYLLRSYNFWHKFPTFGSGARGQDIV